MSHEKRAKKLKPVLGALAYEFFIPFLEAIEISSIIR